MPRHEDQTIPGGGDRRVVGALLLRERGDPASLRPEEQRAGQGRGDDARQRQPDPQLERVRAVPDQRDAGEQHDDRRRHEQALTEVLGVATELEEPPRVAARWSCAILTWKKKAPPTQTIAAKTWMNASALYKDVLNASSCTMRLPIRNGWMGGWVDGGRYPPPDPRGTTPEVRASGSGRRSARSPARTTAAGRSPPS